MFHDERREVPENVAALLEAYRADLAAAIDDAGVDRAIEASGLDREVVQAIVDGELPDLSLEDAAAIQALADGTADPDTIVEIACDHLLLGMSTAVLDVDTVATEVDPDVDPKEVQQKLERRAPMSFEEYVQFQYFIASRQR